MFKAATMPQQVSLEHKAEIVVYYKTGSTQSELAKKYSISQSCVSKIVKRHAERGSSKRKVGSGRNPLLSEAKLKYIKTIIKREPKLGSTKLKNILQEKKKIKVSSRTLRRNLCTVGLPGRVACSKPYLTKEHIRCRFEHAKVWIYHSQKFWDQVIYSDETKINLFGSDGRVYVRREPGTRYEMKHLNPTVKHGGGSIMVWGCFSSTGVGVITIIEGIMDSIKYTRIIDSCLSQSASRLGLQSYTFQQDNDTKHRSKHTKEYFQDKKINVMSWPAQSPDMNPIEHLWSDIKKRVRARNPKNISELKQIVEEEWYKTDPAYCKELVESMPDRAEALYRAKGGHTRY
jgi:transposase